MSLANVMTRVAEFVGDQLVNTCERPAPDRVLRYHGTLPHDCCSDRGFLVVNFEREYPSTQFPSPAANNATPCQGLPVAVLVVRYVVCWPLPDVDANGVRPIDDAWDAKAAVLADVADCITRAFMTLACKPDLTDPFVEALIEATGHEKVRLIETVPIVPLGGCAGVQWRIYCGVRPADTPS